MLASPLQVSVRPETRARSRLRTAGGPPLEAALRLLQPRILELERVAILAILPHPAYDFVISSPDLATGTVRASLVHRHGHLLRPPQYKWGYRQLRESALRLGRSVLRRGG